MLNITYVPSNEQLFDNALKRPRFYALRNSIHTEDRGYIEPRPIDGQLRWVRVNQETGEIVMVPLMELRNARMYLDYNRRREPQSAYLFVYRERAGAKHYYKISPLHVGTWLNQTLRMDMLSETGAGSISSSRHVAPSFLAHPATVAATPSASGVHPLQLTQHVAIPPTPAEQREQAEPDELSESSEPSELLED